MARTEMTSEEWVTKFPDSLHAENHRLRAQRDALLEACKHAVEHHETYVDESGVVCITLQSYALIRKAIAKAG